MGKGGKSSLRRTYGRGDDDDDDVDTLSAFAWGGGIPAAKGGYKGGKGKEAESRGQKRGWQPAWVAKDEDDGIDDFDDAPLKGGRSKGNGKGKYGGGDRKGKYGGKGKEDMEAEMYDQLAAMMPMFGAYDPYEAYDEDKGKGKARRKEKKKIESNYEGVVDATKIMVSEIIHLEKKYDAETMVEYFVGLIDKAAEVLAKDERLSNKGNQMLAVSLLEELVEGVMQPLSQKDVEKEWYPQADLSQPLKCAAMGVFQNSKLFSRMLAPMMEKHIEESVFRFREDERFQNVLWEVVEMCDVDQKYYKKCYNYLAKAYDEAHTQAEFGESVADEPALGVVQDFVKCWISLFIGRAWDVLENGVGGGISAQAAWVTKLFQSLLHPTRCCLSYDLVSALSEPLPADWTYINEVVCLVLAEASAEPKKKKNSWLNWSPKDWMA